MPHTNTNYGSGNRCIIHEEISFAIDEECPLCEHHSCDDDIAPYIERINNLEVIEIKLKSRIFKLEFLLENS